MWWRKREWWLGGCSEEVPDDAQLAANGVFAAMQHPQLGRIETVESLIQLRGVVGRPPSVPPEIGEHTLAVLRDLDYGAEPIEALRGTGTVRAHEGGA